MIPGGMIGLADDTAAILTVGTELTTGIVLDINSQEIARELTSRGLFVTRALSVPDDRPDLDDAIADLTGTHSLVVVTGGLGPTQDDVTREAAAAALGLSLMRDTDIETALAPVAQIHSSRSGEQRVFKQAEVLEGAEVLHPVHGTAPGQIVPTDRGALVLLPGPPHEMKPLLSLVAQRLPLSRVRSHTLSCVGIAESDAEAAAIDAVGGRHGLSVMMLAGLGDIRVVLRDIGAGPESLAEIAGSLRDTLGSACFAQGDTSLAEIVVESAIQSGITIATAESCTGGLIGAALTAVPGSSDTFLGSLVTYSNEAKAEILGVAPEMIASEGAVSIPVVEAMAEGAARRLGADMAVAVSGVAGPGGETERTPVGTVCLGIRTPAGTTSESLRLRGDRYAVRARATNAALHLLRRSIRP